MRCPGGYERGELCNLPGSRIPFYPLAIHNWYRNVHMLMFLGIDAVLTEYLPLLY